MGCGKRIYKEYHGNRIFQGEGGTVRIVNGMEIWENGQPNRKYKIIGIIEEKGKGGLISGIGRDEKVIQEAKEHNADAVIIQEKKDVLYGIDQKSGVALYQEERKILVIRYQD